MERADVPYGKLRSIKRSAVYEALRRKGYSKRRAAMIANSRRARGLKRRKKRRRG